MQLNFFKQPQNKMIYQLKNSYHIIIFVHFGHMVYFR